MRLNLTALAIATGVTSSLLVGCSSQSPPASSPTVPSTTGSPSVASGETGQMVTYRCEGGQQFTVRFPQPGAARDEAIANLPGQGQLTLPAVPVASGAKYSNGAVTVWTKGPEAFVEVNQTVVLKNCLAANEASAPADIMMQANVLTYNPPEMAIATRYPGNMTVDGTCSGEGCGYVFKFRPQGNALDQSEVHIFLERGAKTTTDVETFVTGPRGLMASNGWTVANNATPSTEWTNAWVKKVIPFTAKESLIGQILMGETNGQGVQVTLLYPSTMANSFLPAAQTILNNLQFKADKLPLEPSQN